MMTADRRTDRELLDEALAATLGLERLASDEHVEAACGHLAFKLAVSADRVRAWREAGKVPGVVRPHLERMLADLGQ